jgi:hypothetical protein
MFRTVDARSAGERAWPAPVTAVLLVSLILIAGQALAATPVLVKDIYSGPNASSPRAFLPLGGRLFFVANDGTLLWRRRSQRRFRQHR